MLLIIWDSSSLSKPGTLTSFDPTDNNFFKKELSKNVYQKLLQKLNYFLHRALLDPLDYNYNLVQFCI